MGIEQQKIKITPRRFTEERGSPLQQQVTVRTSIELNEQLYDAYAAQGMSRALDPEQVMLERLVRCVEQADQGLYFNDSQKKRLCNVIGRSVSDAEGALQNLEHVSKIQIGDIAVELEPRLMKRLASRAGAYRKPLAQLVKEEVLKALKEYTGLY